MYGMQLETPGLKAGRKSSGDYDKAHRLVYNCSRTMKYEKMIRPKTDKEMSSCREYNPMAGKYILLFVIYHEEAGPGQNPKNR